MNKTAIYARFSSIDSYNKDDSFSQSIQNQIAILTKYAESHDLNVVKVYADDNRTGSNMNRPELQELLKDAAEGKIDTILVKDLSRFGRSYREVGEYIEKIFPAFNIRFISVNDNYDSINSKDDLSLALKNYINHLYSKESSKKIRKVMALRAEKEPILTTKYGYTIENKVITIDKEAAENVKLIFKLAQDGMNAVEIAKELDRRGILTPAEYAKLKKGKVSEVKKPNWNSGVITSILRDEAYTGKFTNLIQSKYMNNTFRTSHTVSIPAIIDEETFNNTPKLYRYTPEEVEIKSKHLVSIIRCTDCDERRKVSAHKYRYHGGYLSPKMVDDKVMYVCHLCGKVIDPEELETKIYKDLVTDIKKIASNRETYILRMIKELGAVETVALDANTIQEKMKTLFEKYLKGEIEYNVYHDEQNNLTKLLLDNEINKRNLKHQTLTTYSLRNKIIRFLNSVNIKEEDHLEFIRENAAEVFYSFETKDIKFIYPFMKN